VFKVKVNATIIISIDSDNRDRPAPIQVDSINGTDPQMVKIWYKKLSNMHGMYGHLLDKATSPIDLNAALLQNKIEFEILEGREILDLPRAELPPGAIS
jgi:hypothetical protein